MSNKTAFWIFLLGTLPSAVLFLVLTADTQRQVGALTNADNLSDEVVAGKKVWEKYDCNDWPPQDSDKRVARSALRLSAGEGLSLGAAITVYDLLKMRPAPALDEG